MVSKMSLRKRIERVKQEQIIAKLNYWLIICIEIDIFDKSNLIK